MCTLAPNDYQNQAGDVAAIFVSAQIFSLKPDPQPKNLEMRLE